VTKSRRVKHLKDGKCRVIKIDQEALFEFVYESFIDNLENFFDLLDMTTVVSHHQFVPETGEYICLINDENEKLPEEIDIQKLLSKMEKTTTSLYSPNRYKEITFDEIRALLKNRD
jgi:hypothetical protein